MHCPSGIFGISSNIHDDLAETSSNTAFLDRFTQAVETISIRKLQHISLSLRRKPSGRVGEHTMLSKKQVVPVSNISAMLILAAAYPSSAVKFPWRTQIRSHNQDTSSRSSAAPFYPLSSARVQRI
jgi:hypothetical protein